MSNQQSRRRFIAASGTVALTALAGCAGDDDDNGAVEVDDSDDENGTENGDDGSIGEIDEVPVAIEEYLQDAPNYDGTMVDATGEEQVTVSLTDTNVFEPAAIRIDAGTTVEWVWEGGAHNVVSDEDSASDFNSGDVVAEDGTTFDQSFDDDGIQLYYCEPHTAEGMYGAIDVVETED